MAKLTRYTFHLGDAACGASISVRAVSIDEALNKLRSVLPSASVSETAHHLSVPGVAEITVLGWINADEITPAMLETAV